MTAGVDVGGTFTDFVCSDENTGRIEVLKVSTSDDPASSIVAHLRNLSGDPERISMVSHAMTLATNALLTRTGLGRTALVSNEGFRDVLEIGRQRRPDVYDLLTSRPPPLVERRFRYTVRCWIDAHGKEIEPLDHRSAESVASRLVRGGFDSVAVCFLNSYLNPEHEKEMEAVVRREGFRGHVSLSSDVNREYREYERTSTTVVNAALAPLMEGYLSRLGRALRRGRFSAPVYVMNSDGGANTASFASSFPVNTIESGPAAGVVASSLLASQLSLKRVLTFDMGGTTAKAGTVINGEPEITNEFEAAGKTHSGRSIKGSGYPVRGPFIDLAEVSAGGGTIAWLDDAGELQVGPRSAGADPGPACYGKGGTEPTVTDANVVLGRLNPKSLLGGEMKIDYGLANRSVARLARKLGVGKVEAAIGVLRLVNNSMAKAISIVSVERGRDPRRFTLFAFGGAGPLHACDLAEEMPISDLVVPVHAGLFSAYGLLAGKLTRTFSAPIRGPAARASGTFRELARAAAREMKLEGFASFITERFVEARYTGQSHEILLRYGGDSTLRRAFDARHKELYGYSSEDPLEVVNARLRATVPRPIPRMINLSQQGGEAEPSRRSAWVGGRTGEMSVYRREAMRNGAKGRGPCVIEEYDSTLVVNPGWYWKIEGYGTRLTKR